VNDSCLVFDGRMVIDNQFRTADESIFAAGPFSKYSRKYHADTAQPSLYSSMEIGSRLAEAILPMVDPLARGPELGPAELPKFTEPKRVGAKLPGRLTFLRVSSPGSSGLHSAEGRSLVTKVESAQILGDEQEVLAEAVLRLFKIGIDRYSSINSISCLSAKDPQADRNNVMHLYGTHEKYINALVSRYDEGLIEDFFDFFRHPSVLACFHDRFGDFVQEVSEGILMSGAVDVLKLRQATEKLSKLTIGGAAAAEQSSDGKALLAQALGELDQKDTLKFAKERLLDYLTFNAYHLPMYARPGNW